MASEIDRPHVLGNFRKRGLRAKRVSTWRDKRPGMSEDHCVMVRKLPCAACLRVPAGTVHHIKSGTNERGMGVRSTDKWGVPMCMHHHDEIERAGTRNEVAKFQSWGIDDVHELAVSLWQATGNLAQMTKIVIAHHRSGAAKR